MREEVEGRVAPGLGSASQPPDPLLHLFVAWVSVDRRSEGRSVACGCLVLLIAGLFMVVVIVTISTVPPRKVEDTHEHVANAPRSEAPNATERRQILSALKAEHDEFQNATFYKHTKTPVLGTQIYLYIVESGDQYVLRLVVTYQGGSWIFWDKLLVKAGDQVVTVYGGADVKRDSEGGTVLETLDLPVISGTVGVDKLNFRERTTLVFAALMKADTVAIRFQGDRIYDHQIPKGELSRFKDVGDKYMTLFGIKK